MRQREERKGKSERQREIGKVRGRQKGAIEGEIKSKGRQGERGRER